MNQLKHYLKRLRNMNFKRMFEVADKVKNYRQAENLDCY